MTKPLRFNPRMLVLALALFPMIGFSSDATATQDSDLEPGFPVNAYFSMGMYHGGPSVHTLVGNIDSDPSLEILVTGTALGPLYAWKATGAPVPGFPIATDSYAQYAALGKLSTSSSPLDVFSAGYGGWVAAYSGSGARYTGWPVQSATYPSTPPALADVNGDGLDEIFVDEAFGGLHAYRADGTGLPGFPVIADTHEEEVHTPAIADLDGDGTLEIVTATGLDADGVSVYAFHRDGTLVTGFPVEMPVARVDTFPVIGDVDGDGSPEILAGAYSEVYIWSSVGALKRKIPITGTLAYGVAPALADLDADGLPEIVVLTDDYLNAWNGDGSAVSGFPVYFGSGYWAGHSAPVVGDVDGDNQLDIIFTLQMAGDYQTGWVRVYNRHGVLNSRFPKQLYIGLGAVPAIADIDLDGHNEIIITGTPGYYGGYYDKVWVFDLGGPKHGGIEWGQFGGGPRHQSYYLPKQRHFLPLIAR